MAKQLDKRVKDLLSKHDINPRDACWDCHGSWVIYHRYCEIIAAKEGITFDLPDIIEASAEKHTVVICVIGRIGEHMEWSFGEAAPYNLKGAKNFPYAMAEKRAKDRVILKLAGIHGLVYSEEEADDFKKGPKKTNGKTTMKEKVVQATQALDIMSSWKKLKTIGLNPEATKELWQEALAAAGAKSKHDINADNIKLLHSFIHEKVMEHGEHWMTKEETK